MFILLTLLSSLLFGYLSRMCGGGKGSLPYGLDQIVYSIPYGVLTGLVVFKLSWYLWVLFPLSYVVALLGKRTGHGQWMDLGNWFKIVKPEKLDFIVSWFFGKDRNTYEEGRGNYWRDFTGLTVSGLVVGLVTGIVVSLYFSVLLGSLIILCAGLKGLSYAIGRVFTIGSFEELNEPTEIGEYLTGFFAGLPLFYSILLLTQTYFQ